MICKVKNTLWTRKLEQFWVHCYSIWFGCREGDLQWEERYTCFLIGVAVEWGGHIFLDIGNSGVEEFQCKCGWPNRVYKESESCGEFNREGRWCFVGWWGYVKNCAIVFVSERASEGSWWVNIGRMEDPLHVVRILVFDGVTKHPMETPWDLICSHRNKKSGS